MYAIPQYHFFSMALPTLLGGHIHMEPPILHPWPIRGAQPLPAQHHSCHQFCPLSQLLCISLCASDSSPQASNHGDNLLTLRTLPEATHWVCGAGEPISSPSGFAAGSQMAHHALPNTPLHKCSILFITWVFLFFTSFMWMRGPSIFEPAPDIYSIITSVLHPAPHPGMWQLFLGLGISQSEQPRYPPITATSGRPIWNWLLLTFFFDSNNYNFTWFELNLYSK